MSGAKSVGWQHWRSRIPKLLLLISTVIVGIVVISNLGLWWMARGNVVSEPGQLEPAGDEVVVAIVPGARVFPDGRPSLPLRDRLDAAAELYRLGLVNQVLVSGDNREGHYDEPTIMRRELHWAGVPLADLSVDYAGFDTWDTCVRSQKIFGVQRAVFVTQERYANRSASLCAAADLDATVLAVDNPPRYPRSKWIRAVIREPIAAVKGMIEVLVQPDPTHLGPVEGLQGSEIPANPDPALGE